MAIQRALLAFNAGVHNDRQIVLCIGINVGDIIFDGGDIFGDGVNVAARLEALCEAGGVCISRYANEHRGDEWRAAENEIRKLRGSAKQKALPAHQNLAAIVAHEVAYQYALWHGDAEGALSAARPQRVTTAHR